MQKPVVLIVGGAWHTTDYLEPLARLFENEGHPTKLIGLPSVGASPPVSNFLGDVAAIRNATTELILNGKDVIAVLHSLSGISGSEALHGLGKSSTRSSGVTAIVYIASMVPKKGHCFGDHVAALGDSTWEPARKAFAQDGLLCLPPDLAQKMFYNDIQEADARIWTAHLKPQSIGVYDSPLTHETYNEIPCGYLLTSMDQAFSYDYQQKTIEMRGFPKDKTETLETGHTPWLTKPEEVKRFILRIAKEAEA